MEQVQIVYKNNKPQGIRDKTGFLLFFPEIFKYPGQEERYRQETKEQFELVGYLRNQLKLKSQNK